MPTPHGTELDRIMQHYELLLSENRQQAQLINTQRIQISAERALSDGYARTILNSEAEIHKLERQKQFLLDLLTPEQLKAAFLAVLEDM